MELTALFVVILTGISLVQRRLGEARIRADGSPAWLDIRAEVPPASRGAIAVLRSMLCPCSSAARSAR